MAIRFSGMIDLTNELNALADVLNDGINHSGDALQQALQAGAQPILTRMQRNALIDPKPKTYKLANSIKVGKVVRRRNGGWSVPIGVTKGTDGAAYANPVEYGHGGPHPAPPHPFVRPAFDAGKDEAYAEMKAALASAIDHRKRKG